MLENVSIGDTLYRAEVSIERNEIYYEEHTILKLTSKGFWHRENICLHEEWCTFRTKKLCKTKEEAKESLIKRKHMYVSHTERRYETAKSSLLIALGGDREEYKKQMLRIEKNITRKILLGEY